MGGDFVIRKDITLNRAMYIVDSGKVMLLGSDVLKPWEEKRITVGPLLEMAE